MKFNWFILVLIAGVLWQGCAKDNDTEAMQPGVEILSPMPCDTIYFDEPVTLRFRFTANSSMGLGNLSMDVHNNFNHHSHGSHITCEMDPKKDPVNPYEDMWINPLPDDRSEYVFEKLITVPLMKNDSLMHDPGDYHFHIYVTNNDGYQTFTSLDFKLLMRNSMP